MSATLIAPNDAPATLEEFLKRIKDVSTLPHVAMRVVEEAKNENSGAADLKAAALPTFDGLHAAADRALYAAKAAGRDGVMVAPPRLPKRRRIRVEVDVDGGRFGTSRTSEMDLGGEAGAFTRPDDL